MITIVIITYNRSVSLTAVLESFLKLNKLDEIPYELIIVDNNSTDDTCHRVETFINRFNGRLRYVLETHQGPNFARNKGVQESNGDIIAFIDDDIVFHENWLKGLYQFNINHHWDAIGGRVLPLYPDNTPNWVKKNKELLKGPIVMFDYGEETISYRSNKLGPFIGANMVIKKHVFEECGRFDTSFGAQVETMGDDTDFFYRLMRNKKDIYYLGSSTVYHPVEEKRMRLKYIAKWKYKAGRYYAKCNDIIDNKESLISYGGVPRYLFRNLLGEIKNTFLLPFKKGNFIRIWCNIFAILGMMKEFRQHNTSTKTNNLQGAKN